MLKHIIMHLGVLAYIIIISISFSGCTPTQYYKPGATVADFNRDKYDCEQSATAYTANMGFAGNPLIISDEIKQCLEMKYGWQKVQSASAGALPQMVDCVTPNGSKITTTTQGCAQLGGHDGANRAP